MEKAVYGTQDDAKQTLSKRCGFAVTEFEKEAAQKMYPLLGYEYESDLLREMLIADIVERYREVLAAAEPVRSAS